MKVMMNLTYFGTHASTLCYYFTSPVQTKTQTTTTAIMFMMMLGGDGNRNLCPLLSLTQKSKHLPPEKRLL